MLLRTIVAFQMGQAGLNLGLHLGLCAKLFRREGNKALTAAILWFLVTAIVVVFYYLPIYRDYNNSLYVPAIPFTHTGNKTLDQMNVLAADCLPFILVPYTGLFFLLRRNSPKHPLYDYTSSKLLCRMIFVNSLSCALIDLLVTRVLVGDDSVVTLGHAAGRILRGSLFFNLAYLPVVLCLSSKSAPRADYLDEDQMPPSGGHQPPPSESLYRVR